MTWHQIRRIVEGRLYEYGARMAEEPPTPISSAYDSPTPPPEGRHARPSLPERWVMSREDVVAFARLIQALPHQERKLVDVRYVRGLGWRAACRELAVSYSEAKRIRDRAVTILAVLMGLMPGATAGAKEEPIASQT